MTPVVYWLVYAAVGKLLMFIVRKFPPAVALANKREFTRDLLACYMCLGVWFYTFLAFVFGINIIHYQYVPFVSEFITGCITSFLVHVFSEGWQGQFGAYIINV